MSKKFCPSLYLVWYIMIYFQYFRFKLTKKYQEMAPNKSMVFLVSLYGRLSTTWQGWYLAGGPVMTTKAYISDYQPARQISLYCWELLLWPFIYCTTWNTASVGTTWNAVLWKRCRRMRLAVLIPHAAVVDSICRQAVTNGHRDKCHSLQSTAYSFH